MLHLKIKAQPKSFLDELEKIGNSSALNTGTRSSTMNSFHSFLRKNLNV